MPPPDRLKNHLPPGIAPATIDHFSTIPLAQPTLQDPAFVPFPSSRAVTHGGRGHTLTGRTWNSPDTITELLSFRRVGRREEEEEAKEGEVEVRRFYSFGDDLNAHPGLLHGGVIATILDSSLGQAVECAFPSAGDGGEVQGGMYTVQLNVSYKKPVRTPGTVVVRAWVRGAGGEKAGRKVWAEGVVEGDGWVVHARGEGLWVRGSGMGKL